jgi:DNA-binding HxlR family transcriptional regulator
MVKATIAQSRMVTGKYKQAADPARYLRSVSWLVVEALPAQEQPTGVCPHFHDAIELIGKRWTGAIVFALTEGPLRFGELAKAVPGLSDRLLSSRLRELEREGLVARRVEAGSPVRVTYSLTEAGVELGPAIAELKVWAKRWRSG